MESKDLLSKTKAWGLASFATVVLAASSVTVAVAQDGEKKVDAPVSNSMTLPQSATADKWTYWLGAGGLFLEADDPNQPGQLYELRFSRPVADDIDVELGFGGSPFLEERSFPAPSPKEGTFNGKNSPGENYTLKANVGALYHVRSLGNENWDPYLSLVGGTQYYGKARSSRSWEPFGGPGLGVSYWFNPDFALRADYNVVAAAAGNVEINHHALLFAHYTWGREEVKPADVSTPPTDDGMKNLREPESGTLKTIYFDYDKSAISNTSRNTLKENAEWIKQRPGTKVTLEGHCDERGTNEYNMALGARRAKAAAEYLKTLGIPVEQISTQTYGEEMPADPGHNEAAWSKNRRVETVVAK